MPRKMRIGAAACGGRDAEPEPAEREVDLALDQAAEAELRDAPPDEPAPAAREEPASAPARTQRAPARTPPPPPAAAPVEEAPPAVAEAAEETPPEPEIVTVSAPAGVTFKAELVEEISTRTGQVGDAFQVRLVDPIVGGRFVVAPAGTVVRGTVTELRRAGDGEPAAVRLDFREILVEGEWFPIRASVTEANVESRSRQSTGERVAKIGGGAAAGAILGRVIGGNARGAVIGGAVGAAAGTAITLATDERDAVLPAGSVLTLRLESPLEVQVTR